MVIFIPLCINGSCTENYTDEVYKRIGCDLTQIPNNISAGSSKVYLANNKISEIPSDTFENLSQLMVLDLSMNRISEIEPGAFAKLSGMRVLNLQGNILTTLEGDVFRNQYPTNLTLLLAKNPLKCDSILCWIKEGERHGWITLGRRDNDKFWRKPDCENYPDTDWYNVPLSCPVEGNLVFLHKNVAKKIEK